eukprot:gnl/TRDRNA2_/TRDRNA2_134571_c1_seq1.p1 gnl/TRDRNA2_/TRDRNA2_134571_c1~~gnl/TRDRNA2_/TRDRNA2_134571_c1_seq1.p1  ORF type:complete len:362 (-),score=65.48 gnl/TRDRNA2_/TRDRNA2_134571_c1_seq1:109-1194(-)
MRRYGSDADIAFGCHHWPRWGRKKLNTYLRQQRDMYKVLHDQAMRLTNRGFKPQEIAELVRPPRALAEQAHLRGYYGTVKHNVRAVYSFYLGWFQGNPCLLDQLPERESGRRYVECMGGPDGVMRHASKAFEQGDYRWTAELLNHLVQSQPEHVEARALLANTLEQLGYVAESGPWRNFYLTAAQELRMPALKGAVQDGPMIASAGALIQYTPTLALFGILATMVVPDVAAALPNMVVHALFSDTSEKVTLEISNGALHSFEGWLGEAGAKISMTRETLLALLRGESCNIVDEGSSAAPEADDVVVSGGPAARAQIEWLGSERLFEVPPFFFPVVDNLPKAEFDKEAQRFAAAATGSGSKL